MSKVLPLTKPSTDARVPLAAGKRDAKNLFQTITMQADDLRADVRDARTVVAVAIEAWSDEHAPCVGVLELLDYKLSEIQRAAAAIMNHTKTPPDPTRYMEGDPSMLKPVLTLYSVWQRKPDGSIEPFGCIYYPDKSNALDDLRAAADRFSGLCLVRTVHTVCQEKGRGVDHADTHSVTAPVRRMRTGMGRRRSRRRSATANLS